MAITEPSPTVRPPGRPRNVAADREIVAATLRLLSREGYDGTSIEAVAAEAGVTRATVYRRYPTKADMVTAAVCAMTEVKEPGACPDPRSTLIQLLRGFHECVGPNDGLGIAASLYLQRHEHPEMLDSFRQRVIHPTRLQMEAVLKLARDQGAIPATAEPETMIEMLIGSYLYRTLAGRPIPKNWPERMVAAIWPDGTA
jgi:AcrR family transcriptional regulator